MEDRTTVTARKWFRCRECHHTWAQPAKGDPEQASTAVTVALCKSDRERLAAEDAALAVTADEF